MCNILLNTIFLLLAKTADGSDHSVDRSNIDNAWSTWLFGKYRRVMLAPVHSRKCSTDDLNTIVAFYNIFASVMAMSTRQSVNYYFKFGRLLARGFLQ